MVLAFLFCLSTIFFSSENYHKGPSRLPFDFPPYIPAYSHGCIATTSFSEKSNFSYQKSDPSGYDYNHILIETILSKVKEAGFSVSLSNETHLTKEMAEQLYGEHRDKEYFEELTNMMTRYSTSYWFQFFPLTAMASIYCSYTRRDVSN